MLFVFLSSTSPATQVEKKEVASLAQASAAVQEYVKRHQLDFIEFTGGNLYKDKQPVGRITYKGEIITDRTAPKTL